MSRRFGISLALSIPMLVLGMSEMIPGQPFQRLADLVAGHFVPAVLLVSILTFVAWILWGPQPRLAYAVVNAVAVLIVACPCAMGLATPMSVMVGTGRGATAGVLIRSAKALETRESGFCSITGKEVVGQVEGRQVGLGNLALLQELGIDAGKLPDIADSLRLEGQTVMFLAVDGEPAELLGVADPLKEPTPEAIQLLHAEGLRIVMLNGDSRTTAEAKARKPGIDEIQAEVLPEAKGDVVKNIRRNPFFAFIYNTLGVPIAAGALYPVAGMLLSPILASAAMTFSSVSVITNALRLRNVRL